MPKQLESSDLSRRSADFLFKPHFITACTTLVTERGKRADQPEPSASASLNLTNKASNSEGIELPAAKPLLSLPEKTSMQPKRVDCKEGHTGNKAAAGGIRTKASVIISKKPHPEGFDHASSIGTSSTSRPENETIPDDFMHSDLDDDLWESSILKISPKGGRTKEVTLPRRDDGCEQKRTASSGSSSSARNDAPPAKPSAKPSGIPRLGPSFGKSESALRSRKPVAHASADSDHASGKRIRSDPQPETSEIFGESSSAKHTVRPKQILDQLSARITKDQIRLKASPAEAVQTQDSEIKSWTRQNQGQQLKYPDQELATDEKRLLKELQNKAAIFTKAIDNLTSDLSNLHKEHGQLQQQHDALLASSADLKSTAEALREEGVGHQSALLLYRTKVQGELAELGGQLELASRQRDDAKRQQGETAQLLAAEKERCTTLLRQLNHANDGFESIRSSLQKTSTDADARFESLSATVSKAMVPTQSLGQSEQIMTATQDLARHGQTLSGDLHNLKREFSQTSKNLSVQLGNMSKIQQQQSAATVHANYRDEKLFNNISKEIQQFCQSSAAWSQLEVSNSSLAQQLQKTESLLSERTDQRDTFRLQEVILKNRISALELDLQASKRQAQISRPQVASEAQDSEAKYREACQQLFERDKALQAAQQGELEKDQLASRLQDELATKSNKLVHAEAGKATLEDRLRILERSISQRIDEARASWERDTNDAREKLQRCHDNAIKALGQERNGMAQQLHELKTKHDNAVAALLQERMNMSQQLHQINAQYDEAVKNLMTDKENLCEQLRELKIQHSNALANQIVPTTEPTTGPGTDLATQHDTFHNIVEIPGIEEDAQAKQGSRISSVMNLPGTNTTDTVVAPRTSKAPTREQVAHRIAELANQYLAPSVRAEFLNQTLSPDVADADVKSPESTLLQDLSAPTVPEFPADPELDSNIFTGLECVDPNELELLCHSRKDARPFAEKDEDDEDGNLLVRLQQADAYAEQLAASTRQQTAPGALTAAPRRIKLYASGSSKSTEAAGAAAVNSRARTPRKLRARVTFAEQATEPGAPEGSTSHRDADQDSDGTSEMSGRHHFSDSASASSLFQSHGQVGVSDAQTPFGLWQEDIDNDHGNEANGEWTRFGQAAANHEQSAGDLLASGAQTGVSTRRSGLRAGRGSLKRRASDQATTASSPQSQQQQQQSPPSKKQKASGGPGSSPAIPITTSSRRVRAFAGPPPAPATGGTSRQPAAQRARGGGGGGGRGSRGGRGGRGRRASGSG